MELGAEGRTVADLVRMWLEVADHEPSVRYHTRAMLERHVMPELGPVPVAEVTTRDLEALYLSLPLSSSSVRRVHAMVRPAFEQAVRWGWIGANPAAGARVPRPRRPEPRPPMPGAVGALIDQANAERDLELECFVRLAAMTGMRRGELVALRRDDLDLEAGTIRVARAIGLAGGRPYEKATKTGAVHTVAIDVPMASRLRDLLDGRPGSYLFGGERPWRPQTATSKFRRLCRRAGVEVELRSLRHYCATQLIGAGVDVLTVSRRLGHSSPAMTLSVYAGSLPATDRDAAERMGKLNP